MWRLPSGDSGFSVLLSTASGRSRNSFGVLLQHRTPTGSGPFGLLPFTLHFAMPPGVNSLHRR
eukprot:9332465-Alexandrium_andersonii.AAC.1